MLLDVWWKVSAHLNHIIMAVINTNLVLVFKVCFTVSLSSCTEHSGNQNCVNLCEGNKGKPLNFIKWEVLQSAQLCHPLS